MRIQLSIAALVLSLVPTGPVTSGGSCPPQIIATYGHCPTTGTDGTSVNVTGTKTTPGTDPETHTSSDPDERTTDPGTTDPSTPVNPRDDYSNFDPSCNPSWNGSPCVPRTVAPPPNVPVTPPPTTPPTPTVTISDLASFTPPAIALTAEPGNVGIANMPTNFVAAASAQTVNGTLFNFPLSVRFTPIAYDYTYGDGTTATVTTPGRTWGELGQAQFTPTPTSHVYAARGIYAADVDVRYTAEIDFGSGWMPITGELTSDGPAQQIQIFEARTALVAHTCTETPTASGC